MVTQLVNCLFIGYSVFTISTANYQKKNKNINMPFVNIKITKENVTSLQKAQLIKGVTELLQKVLNKNKATTFVIIDEVETDNWGIAGKQVTEIRNREK